jgi:hypothetical protein
MFCTLYHTAAAMPSCSGSETVGSEQNFGAHFLNLRYKNMEQILMHICCNLSGYIPWQVTPDASAGWDPFASYIAADVGMHSQGRIMAGYICA